MRNEYDANRQMAITVRMDGRRLRPPVTRRVSRLPKRRPWYQDAWAVTTVVLSIFLVATVTTIVAGTIGGV